MNEVKIINKSNLLGKEIDVWGSVERPLFRANDLMNWLGIKNVTTLIERVDKEEVLKLNLSSRSGETWFLTEDGLYEVLMSSRKPIAKLKELGIIYSQSGQWHLKMPYKGWNLAGTCTYNYQSSNGEISTSTTLVWNQRGKRFIIALYNNDFNVKRAIAEINGENK